MLTAKYVYLCILLLGCTSMGWTQKTYRSCYGFDCKENKWSISAFAGYPVSGLGKDIQRQVEHSASDISIPGPEGVLRCFPKQHHAELTTDIAWSVEAKYSLTRKSAIAFTAGQLNGNTITGFAENLNDPFFELKSSTYSAALNYTVALRRGRDEISAGPVMAMNIMTCHQPDASHQSSSVFKAGLNVGYTFSIIKTKHWFLGFKANYTWLPDVAMDSYAIEHTLQSFSENSDTCVSAIGNTNVSLQTLQFGLTTGWRF